MQGKSIFQKLIPNFDKLIKYLHMYDINLEKKSIEPAIKNMRVLLISSKIIMNLSEKFF